MEGDNRFSICRLCLSSTDNLIHVFDKKAILEHTLANVITELLRHEVSAEDIYPQCVCTNCVGKLRDFKNFKDHFITNKKLLDCAYATGHISSKEVNTEEINAQEASDQKDDNTHAAYVITPDIPLLEPKDGIEDPLACEDSEDRTFPWVSTWEADPEKAALDFHENECTVKEESQVEIFSEELSTVESSDVLPMENSSCSSVMEPNSWVNLTIKQEEETTQVERSGDVLSTSKPSTVNPMGESSHSSVKETNSWENFTVKQEDETSQDGIEDPLACDDSDDETFPCFSEWKADPEKATLDFRANQCTEEEESQDSGNSQDASDSNEKEGEVKGKTFHCSECGKVYKCPRSYRLHLHLHKFGKTLKCVLCGKYFAHKKALSLHMKCHSDEKLGCEFCGKTFKNKILLRLHMVTHGDTYFKCDICGKRFFWPELLKRHKNLHIRQKDRMCDICGKLFRSARKLQIHKNMHKDGRLRKYGCDQCCRMFLDLSELGIHVRSHTGQRPFPCPVCHLRFTVKCSLHEHTKMQHINCKEAEYQCVDCGLQSTFNLEPEKKIYSSSSKGLEVVKDSVNSQDASDSIEKEEEVKRKTFSCSECGKKYICLRAYRRHVDVHKFGKTFKCFHCDKCFSHNNALSQHMMWHSDERYSCDTCGKSYNHKQTLRTHQLYHGHRNFKCKESEDILGASDSNVKEGEGNAKMYPCSECEKVYKCPRAYRRHVDMHKFGKTLKCVHCDKCFAHKVALSAHMICHSDEKLSCDNCGKTFKNKFLLRFHMKIHGDRNYKCEICGKAFYANGILNQHKKTHRSKYTPM